MNPQQQAGVNPLPDERIAELTTNFTGREWVFQEIDRWLAEPDGSRFFLLTGPPGSGKSAVAARLVQINQGQVPAPDCPYLAPGFLVYAHFCRTDDPVSLRPARFVEGLSQALAAQLPSVHEAVLELSRKEAQTEIVISQRIGEMAPGAQVTGAKLTIQVLGDNVRAAFDNIVRRPLKRMETAASPAPLVILIDALDETLIYHTRDHLVRLLRDELDADEGLPDWLRFLLASRPDDRIQLRRGLDPLGLVRDAPAEADDVRAYSLGRLQTLEPELAHRIATRISDAAEGIFLYARYVLDDLERSDLPPANWVDVPMPKGLKSIYGLSWSASWRASPGPVGNALGRCRKGWARLAYTAKLDADKFLGVS